jgi:hypothetical protein
MDEHVRVLQAVSIRTAPGARLPRQGVWRVRGGDRAQQDSGLLQSHEVYARSKGSPCGVPTVTR